ncbi:MAG: TIGR02449 family protein [Granulosicoccaceae bacterium]
MSQPELNQCLSDIEAKLKDVISLCERLRLENTSLLDQQNSLVEERARLIEKNEQARSKVEQMIMRLKSLEASQ